MSSRIVVPDTKKIDISGGDWLIVKGRLSSGDRDDSYERMYLKNPDGSFVVHPKGHLIVGPSLSRYALITAYLLDWSLMDPDGKPLVIRDQSVAAVTSFLRALDPASLDEIYLAISRHDEVSALERAAQKKTGGGDHELSATSSSPNATAGATSGSGN